MKSKSKEMENFSMLLLCKLDSDWLEIANIASFHKRLLTYRIAERHYNLVKNPRETWGLALDHTGLVVKKSKSRVK